jgi:hypothetical protein
MSTFTYKTLSVLALAGALLAAPAFAEEAHHPEEAVGTAASSQAAPAGMGMMGGKDMSKMHEMMQQMHAAKTPEEKQKIRAEHHKAMQDRMAMMRQGMQNSQCPMAKDDAAQQQCMKDMHQNMQGMMQMMEQMLQNQSMQHGQ